MRLGFSLSLSGGQSSGVTITLAEAIAAVPFTAAAPEGYVFVAGNVTIRVQAATPTGTTTDVAGTITTAGVVDEVTDGAFAAAVDAAGAIAPATVQVRVIGAVAQTIAYQWYSLDGSPIPGATGETYVEENLGRVTLLGGVPSWTPTIVTPTDSPALLILNGEDGMAFVASGETRSLAVQDTATPANDFDGTLDAWFGLTLQHDTDGALIADPADNIIKAVTALPFSATAGTFVVVAKETASSGVTHIGALYTNFADRMQITLENDGDVFVYVVTSNSSVVAAQVGTIADGEYGRVAFAWSADDFAASLNGGGVATDSAGALPSVANFTLGRNHTAGNFAPNITHFAYFPERKSNSFLQAFDIVAAAEGPSVPQPLLAPDGAPLFDADGNLILEAA